jgi:tetratricopeptide (TPR) repeat protein
MRYLKITIFLILLFSDLFVSAQASNRELIYNAYIQGNMKKWESVIISIEKQKPSTLDEKFELISYYYGHIGYLLGIKNYEQAARYIDKGDKLIADVLKHAPKNATAYAFKGSFIGFRIGMSKFKAITLGPESSKSIAHALQLEPANIQAHVDKANALYHTPGIFGGDKKQSLKLFLKATTLLEKSKQTDNNWFYLNVLTLTAKNYEALEQYQNAKAIYEKIMRISLDYKWVKNELYPALLKKMD